MFPGSGFLAPERVDVREPIGGLEPAGDNETRRRLIFEIEIAGAVACAARGSSLHLKLAFRDRHDETADRYSQHVARGILCHFQGDRFCRLLPGCGAREQEHGTHKNQSPSHPVTPCVWVITWPFCLGIDRTGPGPTVDGVLDRGCRSPGQSSATPLRPTTSEYTRRPCGG